MTKITISSLIKIMNETCHESMAVLEGLKKSIFIQSGNELINPDKLEFRIAEKEMLQGCEIPEYIISISWLNKKLENINCRIDPINKKIILCNVIGDSLDCLETKEQKDFIELNKYIIYKALEEANANQKYVSLSSCNMWQSTLSRYYSKPHSLLAENLNGTYEFDINGTQLSLKNGIDHLWFDVYKNIFSQSKSSIYVVREKDISNDELQNLHEIYFDKLYIDINDLPGFWQSLICQSSKLSLKKQN
ncbi:MAG: hypothetical protein IJO33_04475 [Bacilli bacterium]|nr:hypothetical protein [Bacilli bacterium]